MKTIKVSHNFHNKYFNVSLDICTTSEYVASYNTHTIAKRKALNVNIIFVSYQFIIQTIFNNSEWETIRVYSFWHLPKATYILEYYSIVLISIRQMYKDFTSISSS